MIPEIQTPQKMPENLAHQIVVKPRPLQMIPEIQIPQTMLENLVHQTMVKPRPLLMILEIQTPQIMLEDLVHQIVMTNLILPTVETMDNKLKILAQVTEVTIRMILKTLIRQIIVRPIIVEIL